MKKTITILLSVGALASCGGGVDRDGSRDLFIEQIEAATGFSADADCVDNVLDQYTDDELKEFDKLENRETAEVEEFSNKLIECVDLTSGE